MSESDSPERFVEGVRAALEECGVTTADLLVVAVSGGPDSLSLLHALHRLSGDSGPRLHCAYLDHGLRGEASRADAAFVAEECRRLGVPLTSDAVDVEKVRAFLPGSLVDVRPVKDTSYLEGKPLEFKVIKIDQRRSNVVVSRRAVVESENTAERQDLLDSLKEGVSVKGVVKNLTDYGAFLDLGGIDGLLHITDMAWKRVKDPSEIVEIGNGINFRDANSWEAL